MSWLRGAPARPEGQFANEVIALVRAVLGLKAKRLGDFALLIERPDGAAVTMNLHTLYLEAQQLCGRRTSRAAAPGRACIGARAAPG